MGIWSKIIFQKIFVNCFSSWSSTNTIFLRIRNLVNNIDPIKFNIGPIKILVVCQLVRKSPESLIVLLGICHG